MTETPDLSQIPAVDRVLEHPGVQPLYARCGRGLVVDAVRASVADLREALLSGSCGVTDPADLLESVVVDVAHRVDAALSPRLGKLVNATGIVLHTNLGRAPLPTEAVRRITEIGAGYSNLEVDLETGQRGSRNTLVEGFLKDLTGAEAAAVVNNNAAALLLALNTLALGQQAVVSRGQLIEIGGSFRLPDIMARSGVEMVEVGTTNRTHLSDYEDAITDRTGLLVTAHTSNYRVVGFTSEVPLTELADLGRRRSVPVVHDLGGGVLVDLRPYGLPYEPLVSDSVNAGVDVVTFSGDKALGGPQCGIIVGRKDAVEQIRNNPLMRAVRCGKLTYAALEATLRLYLNPDELVRTHPTLRMLTVGTDVLRRRARGLIARLGALARTGWEIWPEETPSQAGSGTLPLEEIPSIAVCIRPTGTSSGDLAARLRRHEPPVLGYVREDVVYLNLRAVAPKEVRTVADAVLWAAGQPGIAA